MKILCPSCGQKYELDDEYTGQEVQCTNCNCTFKIQPPTNKVCGTVKQAMKEYKVLTQKDQWFSGKFDPALLEKALNSYAAQGWRVISAATASFPGLLSGNREEMVIIMERDK